MGNLIFKHIISLTSMTNSNKLILNKLGKYYTKPNLKNGNEK